MFIKYSYWLVKKWSALIIVQLGPSPKLKFQVKRFGPKQNTKLALKHHHPPTHHHKLFCQLQDYYKVESQYTILILVKKGILLKILSPHHLPQKIARIKLLILKSNPKLKTRPRLVFVMFAIILFCTMHTFKPLTTLLLGDFGWEFLLFDLVQA